MRSFADLDMYRKVPTDLLEGTRRGSIMSYMAVFIMGTLVLLETSSFLGSRWIVDLALDSNKDPRVRVNFNITMCDLKCEFAVVDVVSVLGTDQNVTSNINKWHLDAQGVRQRFQGRNRQQHDILMLKDDKVLGSIEELHENGEDAVSLDATTLEFAKNENEYLFVDFYASWCSHCRDLAPTWETLAEVMDTAAAATVAEEMTKSEHQWTDADFQEAKKMEKPVMIAKVDCVLHQELCRTYNIRAYPSLQLIVGGRLEGKYRGHRTVMEMVQWLSSQEEKHMRGIKEKMAVMSDVAKDRMNFSDEEKQWSDNLQRQKLRTRTHWKDEDHPGCQLSGHIMVDRVPGNFHIQARSAHHDLAPHMTNVSHIIHHLSIGEPFLQRLVDSGQIYVPDNVKSKMTPMNGNIYLTQDLHEAYHHYLKVVTTNVDEMMNKHQKGLKAYQILGSSQLAFYRNDIVPEAKFIYDLSPISVAYKKTSRRWYDYLTSLMAIVGGTFTVFGMFESGIHAAAGRKRRY